MPQRRIHLARLIKDHMKAEREGKAGKLRSAEALTPGMAELFLEAMYPDIVRSSRKG